MPPRARKETRRSNVLLNDDEGLLRLRDVLDVVPVSERSWYRGIQAGRYPAPVRLAPRTVAWRVRDIRQLLASV